MTGPTRADSELIRNLVTRWFREVWDAGKRESIHEMMHPEAVIHGIGTEAAHGPEGFEAFWRTVRLNYHDIVTQIDQLLVEGAEAVALLTITFVQTSSGEAMSMRGAATFRFEDGQIIFSRNVIDYLAVLGQSDALGIDIQDALFPIQALENRDPPRS